MYLCHCVVWFLLVSLQILVVDNAHSQLVTCGTVFQGTCQSRVLANIALYSTDVKPGVDRGFVAGINPSNPVVAFTAPGPLNSMGLYMYVGTDDQPSSSVYALRSYPYGVSRRYLSGTNIFEIRTHFDGLETFALLSEEAATSVDFLVKYVSGFSVSNFSYFLSTQPAIYPPTSSTQRISKLSQVCHADEYFDSYVEMPISCHGNGRNYNLVQAATVLQPGSRLASRLGVPVTEHLLVAAFYDNISDSALCVYRLSDIRQRFTENIQTCYNSSTLLVGKQFLGADRYCTPAQVCPICRFLCFTGLIK